MMDEQGGSRGGDLVIALRQVAENTIEKAMLIAHISLCLL